MPKGEKKTIITYLPATVLAHTGGKQTAKFTKKTTKRLPHCTDHNKDPNPDGKSDLEAGERKRSHGMWFCFVLTCSSQLQGRNLIQTNAIKLLSCVTLQSSGYLA